MENVKFTQGFDELNPPKLSTGLNVLTILTFIGSAIQIVSSIWGYMSAKTTYDSKDKMLSDLNAEGVPDIARKMVGDPDKFIEMVTKTYENRLPILIIGIVAAALCIYGAMQMRKLKKQGFTFYLVGELLPFLSLALFIGAVGFSGIGFIISIVIALVFIVLYAMQTKNMS